MKSNRRKTLWIITTAFWMFLCVMSCGKTDLDTEVTVIETTEQDASTSVEEANWDLESQVVKTLTCLKNGDTKSLVGLSFGDALDYDKYRIGSYSGAGVGYCPKAAGYGYNGADFLFNGKGMGFSGLMAWSGDDFFGITMGEDTLETLTDVLGESDTFEKKAASGKTEFWATWNFETAALTAKIDDGIIYRLKYCANGNIADAKEKAAAETDLGKDRIAEGARVEAIYNWSATSSSDSENSYAEYHPQDEGNAYMIYGGQRWRMFPMNIFRACLSHWLRNRGI